MSGFDPISYDTVNLETWLRETDDNIVLYTNINKKPLCLKKSYFLNTHMNDIYHSCKLENNELMINETYKSEPFRNIGYFFDKYTMINNKLLIRDLKKKKNIFKLTVDTDKKEFINREFLELTQIGLANPKTADKQKQKLNKKLLNKNIPHKEDVYFNELISRALFNYSWQWDAPINNFLRKGIEYFDTELFKKYQKRYGATKKLAIQAIKDRISQIDRCFIEAAPKVQDDKRVFYRGMTTGYGFTNVNDEIVVRNFTSVSDNIDVAFSFYNKETKCCIHEITLQKGLPYINMVTNTKFKSEKEILLPRDIIFKLVGFKDVKRLSLHHGKIVNISIRKIIAYPMKQKQFTLDTGCKLYDTSTIEVLKNLIPSSPKIEVEEVKLEKLKTKKVKVLKQVPKNIENNLNTNVPKLKRCPNGTIRNKTSGICEKKTIKKKNKTEKLPRCPKGTRRNKSTKKCEPK